METLVCGICIQSIELNSYEENKICLLLLVVGMRLLSFGVFGGFCGSDLHQGRYSYCMYLVYVMGLSTPDQDGTADI